MDPATKKEKFIELQQLSKEICDACRAHNKETVAAKYVTEPFFHFIQRLLHVDPRKRLSAKEAKEEYKVLLPNMRKYLTSENVQNYLVPIVGSFYSL